MYYGQDSIQVQIVNNHYKKLFKTTLLAINNKGDKLVLQDSNQYGKSDFKLYNTVTGENLPIINGIRFDFLTDNILLIKAASLVRFQNFKTNKITDVVGNPTIYILKDKTVLLYDMQNHSLTCFTKDGEKKWVRQDVKMFELSEERKNIIYYSLGKIYQISEDGSEIGSRTVEGKIIWLKNSMQNVYAYTGDQDGGILWNFEKDLTHAFSTKLKYPYGYTIYDESRDYIEVQENNYLILPLIKSDFRTEQNTHPNLVISYTNKNSMEKLPNLNLFIYDIQKENWIYQTTSEVERPAFVFLNNKGDFISYDVAEDFVERESNPIADVTLILNYGKEKHKLGKLRTEIKNYYWDDDSGSFLYFKNAKWWCYSVSSHSSSELKIFPDQRWLTNIKEGITDEPYEAIVSTSEKSKVIISSSHDLFLINLKNKSAKRLTKGQSEDMVYRIWENGQSFGAWNNKITKFDLKNGGMVHMLNTKNYHSGVAYLNENKVKTLVFEDTQFKKIIENPKSNFAISYSLFAPLQVFRLSKNGYQVVFDNKDFAPSELRNIKKQLFQYSTTTGIFNSILIYPKNYNPEKKYPMIVNVYENNTWVTFDYNLPSLRSEAGFNYLHYSFEDYFVLLPDLEYEIGNVRKKYIESLESCVKHSLTLANIDKQNIAVIGVSYGGYGAGIAISGSKLFKTGIIGSMISDLPSMALSQTELVRNPNYQRTETYQMRMNESLFENYNNYLEQSPLFHLPNVSVPLLVWYGTNDNNIPTQQTEAYFYGLKRLSKKAVLLEYESEGHTILNPVYKEDINIRIWQWMEYFLKNKPPAEWIKPLFH